MSYSRSYLLISILVLFSISAFAVDGVVLINQASVMAAGGFPYTITQSGSYRLSGNLIVPAGVDGIDIKVDNVTLDLNGFTIKGQITCVGQPVTSCTKGLENGIEASSLNNISVRNGTVAGFSTGVDLSFGTSELIEDIQASGNNFAGIFGGAGVVRHSTANGNLFDGIQCILCVIVQSTALYNGIGVNALTSTIMESMISSNGTYGIFADAATLYGSNTLIGNLTPATGGTSQKNNVCGSTGALC